MKSGLLVGQGAKYSRKLSGFAVLLWSSPVLPPERSC